MDKDKLQKILIRKAELEPLICPNCGVLVKDKYEHFEGTSTRDNQKFWSCKK